MKHTSSGTLNGMAGKMKRGYGTRGKLEAGEEAQ